MSGKEISKIVQSIMIKYFDVDPTAFDWEKTLECLQEDFKMLDYLIFMERLVQQQFEKEISLLDYISTAIHTPKDIVDLIVDYYKNKQQEVVL